MVIVSACLSGVKCRYDGGDRRDVQIEEMWRIGEAFPVCPEELGGFPTPRACSEIETGDGADVLAGRSRVINADGKDVTAYFLQGAGKALAVARALGAVEGIFKARSPSCGVSSIRQRGELVRGPGVCAALFLREGIALSER